MDKLILIDDDAILRRAVSQSIDWEKHGIRLCGAARDAIEGIELIARYEPDVVVTDIRMPQISGIELCGIINREYPGVKTILLSGHEEFEYAQKAIESRVFAYLTKPVKNDALVEMVKRAIAEKRRENDRQQLLDAGMPLVRSKIFREAFNCNIPPEKLDSLLQLLGVKQWSCCMVAILRLSADEPSSEALCARAATAIEAAANDPALTCGAQLANLGAMRFAAVLFSIQPGEELGVRMLTLGQRLCTHFQNECQFHTCGVISRLHPISPMALQNAYAEAADASIWNRYESFEGMVFASEHVPTEFEDEATRSERLQQYMKQLAATLLDPDADWEAALENCMRMARDNRVSLRAIQVNALRFLTRLHERSTLTFDPSTLENDQLHIMSQTKPQPVFDRIRDHCIAFRGQMDLTRRSRSQVLADKAVAYLNLHYADPEMSLAMIANEMDVSYTYLSQVFTSEAGQSFQSYLQTLRMEKAKELLAHGDLKNYEIAEKVGFSNAYYFSACFKKYTGMTVSEYRKHF